MGRKSYRIINERFEKMREIHKVNGEWEISNTISVALLRKGGVKTVPLNYGIDAHIAKYIDVDVSTFARVKKGKQGIAHDKLENLGKLLNCNWEYLCGESEIEHTPTAGESFNEKYQKRIKEYQTERAKPGYCSFDLSYAFGEKNIIGGIKVNANQAPLDVIIKKALRYPGGYEIILEALRSISGDIKMTKIE